MPTIAEPLFTPPPLPIHGTALASEMVEAIRLDLADRGIRPTPLNVLALALDTGLPEAVAVHLAGLVEQEKDERLAA